MSRERYQGYSRAMQEAGIAVDPALIVSGDFTEISGQAASAIFIRLSPERRPTAIFSASDQMAFGCWGSEENGLTGARRCCAGRFDDIGLSALSGCADHNSSTFPKWDRSIELLLSRSIPIVFHW